jgi:hypothetical protein
LPIEGLINRAGQRTEPKAYLVSGDNSGDQTRRDE